MSSAGQQVIAGRIPGERIETATETTDSANFTNAAEVDVLTVTAPLVSGRTYRVRAVIKFASSVAADHVLARIREDNTTGGLLTHWLVEVGSTSAFGWGTTFEGEYTAVATANKTFVTTAIRNAGTGNCRREASTNGPSLFYVEYIQG